MRNTLIILAVLIVLGVIGGIMNNRREMTSACADDRYVDFIRPEMIDDGRGKGYLNQSFYYGALEAALESERLEAAQRSTLEAEMAEVQKALESGKVHAREVSPSSSGDLTCDYKLMIGKSEVTTRFKLSIQDMPGTEFEKNYNKRQRSLILLQELQPGVPVETVKVAKLGLRQTKVNEPEFRGVRFDQSFTPDTIIREGVVADIPR